MKKMISFSVIGLALFAIGCDWPISKTIHWVPLLNGIGWLILAFSDILKANEDTERVKNE